MHIFYIHHLNVDTTLLNNFILHVKPQLLSARDMAQRTFIGQDRIVYSTERDLNEQDYDSQDWDRRLKELEKSD